jgi:hypothetical protein
MFARTNRSRKPNQERVVKMNQKACECEHDFTLVLTGVSELTQTVEDALFNAGCDDATIAVRSGRLFVTFSRSAESLKDAIISAIRAVWRANIGADVLRVDYCNLVTQSDIARRIKRSRQLVHQYMIGARGPGGFPPPACEISDEAPLWYWCEVAYWLWENNMIKEDVLRDAQEVDIINSVLELRHQQKMMPELTDEIMRTVQSGSG